MNLLVRSDAEVDRLTLRSSGNEKTSPKADSSSTARDEALALASIGRKYLEGLL